jgi:hypothetical protein
MAFCLTHYIAAGDMHKRGRSSGANSVSRLMTPADLLHSLVAVYPPENSKLERSGALKGDRHDLSAQLPEMIKASEEAAGVFEHVSVSCRIVYSGS